jgi:hypothetical protein
VKRSIDDITDDISIGLIVIIPLILITKVLVDGPRGGGSWGFWGSVFIVVFMGIVGALGGCIIGFIVTLVIISIDRLVHVFKKDVIEQGKDVIEQGIDKDQEEETPQRRRSIPKSVQREVWRRDQGRCVSCGSRENLEYDHIIPVSKGGANTVRNIQLLCEHCNRSKHNKIGG